ncbi:MAG: hypothetical protein LBF56_00725 [Holosporales bacterium]|jgi:trigger factor|nr:hypothetical protein [Holosporales bacterium]
MRIDDKKSDGLTFEYKVTITADDVEGRILQKLNEEAKTFKMHGFRLGHVPLRLIRPVLESKITTDVIEQLIAEARQIVIDDAGATKIAGALMQHSIDKEYTKGGGMSITVTAEISPEVKLRPYDLALTQIVPKISEDDITENMKSMMEQVPIYEDAPDGYCIRCGDKVICEIVMTGKVPRKKQEELLVPFKIPEEASQETHPLYIFVGQKTGALLSPPTKNELYGPGVRGFLVRKIQVEKTPSGIEEYAKANGFSTEEELRGFIKELLEINAKKKAYMYTKSQILETLAKQYDFDVPASILEREAAVAIRELKEDIEERNRRNAGKQPPQEIDEEKLREEYAETIKQRVVLGYVLNAIAMKEGITITDANLISEVKNLLQTAPSDDERRRIVEYYRDDKNRAYAKAEMLEHRVINFLISKSKVSEVEKTSKELDQLVTDLFDE